MILFTQLSAYFINECNDLSLPKIEEKNQPRLD